MAPKQGPLMSYFSSEERLVVVERDLQALRENLVSISSVVKAKRPFGRPYKIELAILVH